MDGGRWVSTEHPDTKKYDGLLSYRISDPVNEGYDFAGWDINGKNTIAKSATEENQRNAIDTNATWNGHQGTANLKALWTKNNDTLTDQYDLAAQQSKLAAEKVDDAEKAAAAANKAAENALAAATEADKNDGSEPGKLASVGSKLKDANGEYTGYVVTNADPSNPEVEYVATDADKKAKKITIKTTKKGKIKIGDKAFRVKPDKAKIRVKGAKGKYKDKIVKHVKKNAKKTADVK